MAGKLIPRFSVKPASKVELSAQTREPVGLRLVDVDLIVGWEEEEDEDEEDEGKDEDKGENMDKDEDEDEDEDKDEDEGVEGVTIWYWLFGLFGIG